MLREFEIFAEALPDPLLLVSSDRKVVGSNAAARHFFAGEPFRKDPLRGDFVTLLRDPEAIACVRDVLAGGDRKSVRIMLPVPIRLTLELHAAGLPIGDSGATGALVLLRNISDIVESDKVRNDFVANVSHELRSPLTVLSGLIETLQTQARRDSQNWPRLLSIMGSEASRMVRLVDDLLALSRVTAREHQQPTGTVCLQEVLRDTLTALGDMIAKENRTLRIVQPDEDCLVAGDRDELRQVFRNLIENAFKYGRADSEVLVTIEKVERISGSGDSGYAFAVADQGEGIAAEDIPRLTERFYRVDKSRSREKGGTGLGLAIVKHVVKRHRGRLTILSEIGKGSCFAVQIPVRQDHGDYPVSG